MHTIQVDFEVFKELTRRRPSESVSENVVLRELLGLPGKPGKIATTDTAPGDWITKGVRFPEGTEFRATYKGKTYLAKVRSGALDLHGKRYDSPSAAAMSITSHPANGWTFWECRTPGRAEWRILKALRESA